MLDRRAALTGGAALALGASLAPAVRAAAIGPREIELVLRLEPPMTLGGAGADIPLPSAATAMRVAGDAVRVRRTADGISAAWAGGALSPWIEITIRMPAPSGNDAFAPPAPQVRAAAGPLEPSDYRWSVLRR
ncbi:hypothetical protein [Chenggangzhangella methanolivorans]|uniref:Uncharacterized protein n=1 Tax=Chenggangzhangella methanolivorans TaxID=1437009 RepID=A0A9E6RF29_9HYPH|nr:hypothetical protein [Chenggangzhangella methanolivorans]QZO00051.1 hypothetical protein K6K41_26360 [Chenggangzhangella methanolivorans]